jgi:small subunit ribosomal protein S16
MAVRLRLQRQGKKGKPFYHLVAADARAKRDGRFIEKLGTYNPNTNPATIEVVHDRALHWLQVGAEPSDTARAILKYSGAIYHNHLLNGVRKGAMTEAEAQKRFDAWFNDKQTKIQAKRDGLDAAAEKELKDRMAAERKQNDERAAALAAAASDLAAEAEAAAAETAAEEAGEEAPAAEAPAAEAAAEASPAVEAAAEEAPEAEAAEEAPEAEAAEEAPEAEAAEEAPEAEVAEEAPEAEAAEEAPEAEAAEEAPEAEAAEEEKKDDAE